MHEFAVIAAKRGYISALFSVPGFTVNCCRPDWMHTVCLGTGQYLGGNCLWELLVQELHHRRNKKNAAHILYTVVKAASADLGIDTPFGSLTRSMIRLKYKFKPRLKLKAAELRRFAPMLKHMLKNHFNCTTPRQRTRLNCVHHLDACYREMEDGTWNDDTSQAMVADHTRKFLMRYKELQDGK